MVRLHTEGAAIRAGTHLRACAKIVSEPKSKYRIQAVAEMTGIPAATLRAWERRYGVPSPMRTESADRLYSDSDIDVIRKLRELTENGMAPAEAARVYYVR